MFWEHGDSEITVALYAHNFNKLWNQLQENTYFQVDLQET